MNTDSWTASAAALSSRHFSEAAIGAALAILLLCASAWHRSRRNEFGAASVLVLAESLHLALFAGALDGLLQPPTLASLAAATLAISYAALLWITQTSIDIVRGPRIKAFCRANACGLLLAAIALAANDGVLAWLAPLTGLWCAVVAVLLAIAGIRHIRVRAQNMADTLMTPLYGGALAICCTLTALALFAAAAQDIFQMLSPSLLAVVAALTRALLPPAALLLGPLRPVPAPPSFATGMAAFPATEANAGTQRAARMLAAAYAQVEGRLAALTNALDKQGQMHSLMSHEMRGPVSTISAATQSLEIILAGSDEQVDSRLQRIGRSIARITELMDQLLGQNLSPDDILAPDGQRVDLSQLASDVVEGLRLDVAHRLDVHAALPAFAWCDGPLTGVVLRNIVHNATKYSPADQAISIEVGTQTDADGDFAWIAVTDHGPGIDKDDQVRIFDSHFRRKEHRETKGLGIGLHLVRKICERQGGALTVQSEPGQGARFVIKLPARPPA
jgi:two-component system OmpR family sensor kinase